MAVIATVSKFGMDFTSAYHKVENLTYRSYDESRTVYGEPVTNEEGETLPGPITTEWVKKTVANYEVGVYATQATRDAHADYIYRENHSFEVALGEGAADILAQAYADLKLKDGYSDAVDA